MYDLKRISLIWLAYLEIRLDPVDVIENLDAHEYVEICDPVSDI